MTFKKTVGMLTTYCLVAALCSTANIVSAAETVAPVVASSTATQAVSVLDGKVKFNLQGYEKQPVPGGGAGTMYVNSSAKRVIVVGEDAIPAIARQGNDGDFFEGLKTIKDQQKKASPDYKVTSEKTEKVKGMEVYHIEATSKMEGKDVLQATLLAATADKFMVIQVISNSKDKAGHKAEVNTLLGK